MTKGKVAIIGAGPAGLVCAYELATDGYDVEVFESDEKVGGMCKTIDILGQRVDLGPHVLVTKNERVMSYWKGLLNEDELIKPVQCSTLLYNKKFFKYPLSGIEPLVKLGFFQSVVAIFSYFKYKLFPVKGDSFEHYMTNAFGKKLFSIFFKPYSEKVWDVGTTQIDKSVGVQRIKKIIFSPKNSKNERFAYPKMGNGVPYEKLAEKVIKAGGKIHTRCKVTKILTQSHKASGLRYIDDSGKERQQRFDIIISTANFKDMLLSMDEMEPLREQINKLTYRSTILVYLELNPSNRFKYQWCYIASPEIKTGRYTNFSLISPSMQNGNDKELVVLEYWCSFQDSFWREKDDNLIGMTKKDLLLTGLVNEDDIGRGEVVRLKHSYPYYPVHFSEMIEPIYKELKKFDNLYFIGRCGTHRYINQHQSIMNGLLCAGYIKGNTGIDIWADSESMNTSP